MLEEGEKRGAKGHPGSERGGRLAGEDAWPQISHGNRLGPQGRQKIKSRDGMSGKETSSFAPSPQRTGYRLWGQEVTAVIPGVSASRRHRGCIAKALALTPVAPKEAGRRLNALCFRER